MARKGNQELCTTFKLLCPARNMSSYCSYEGDIKASVVISDYVEHVWSSSQHRPTVRRERAPHSLRCDFSKSRVRPGWSSWSVTPTWGSLFILPCRRGDLSLEDYSDVSLMTKIHITGTPGAEGPLELTDHHLSAFLTFSAPPPFRYSIYLCDTQ